MCKEEEFSVERQDGGIGQERDIEFRTVTTAWTDGRIYRNYMARSAASSKKNSSSSNSSEATTTKNKKRKMFSGSSSSNSKKSKSKSGGTSAGSGNKPSKAEVAAEKLFTIIADENDPTVATMDGIVVLCEQLDLDPFEDIRVLVLLYKLGAKEKPAQISKQEFVTGCVENNITSIETMKKFIPSLDVGFMDQTEFKEFYKVCGKQKQQRGGVGVKMNNTKI